MSDEDQNDQEKKEAAAHVWARDGEGPHAVVEPSDPSQGEANTEARQSMTDLQDLVVMAAASQPAPVTVGADVPATGGAITPGGDGEPGKAAGEAEVAPIDGAAGHSQLEVEDAQAPAEDEAEEEAGPVSDGTPTKNDLAIGYMLPLILYFVFYLVNFGAGGYCLSSERMNALAEIGFYWAPALCALSLLLGGKLMKVTGAVLLLPFAGAAIYAGQYFHTYERFQTQISTYGPLVNAYDANGWRICRYESSWVVGNMPGTTYTREKDVAPYIVYTKKMRLGEPP